MEILDTLVLMASFTASVSASPVKPVQIQSGSTSLAVLLILCLFLSFMVISKQIFMRNRRILPSTSGSLNALFLSLIPKLSSNTGVRRGSGNKTGFLVGIFGSPSWEIRAETIEPRHKSGWKEPRNASEYQLHTSFRFTNVSPTHGSSPTILNVAQSQSVSTMWSTPDDMRTPYDIHDVTGLGQWKTQSLRLPACNIQRAFQFSIPTIHQKQRHTSFIHKKSTRILVGSRAGCSDAPVSSSLASASLRLVGPNDSPELPLPLSRRPRHTSFSRDPQKGSTLGAYFDPNHCTSPVTTLLPLSPPPLHIRSYETSIKDVSRTRTSPFHLSCPYVLTTSNSKNIGIYPRSGEAPHLQECHVNTDDTSPLRLALMSKTDYQNSLTREPLITPSRNCNLLVPQISPIDPSLFLGVPPRSPANSSNLSKVGRTKNITSLPARRSPAIGPSPLRSVILPEPPDASRSPQPTSKGKETSEDPSQGNYTSSGPTYPLVNLPVINKVDDIYEERKNRRHGAQISARLENEGQNTLLEMIQELVEETNAWDASLFMDENFKAMIKSSGMSPSHRGTVDDRKRISLCGLADHSECVILGEVEIDVSRSDEILIPAVSAPKGNCARKVVSFWEDHSCSDEIGLAW